MYMIRVGSYVEWINIVIYIVSVLSSAVIDSKFS